MTKVLVFEADPSFAGRASRGARAPRRHRAGGRRRQRRPAGRLRRPARPHPPLHRAAADERLLGLQQAEEGRRTSRTCRSSSCRASPPRRPSSSTASCAPGPRTTSTSPSPSASCSSTSAPSSRSTRRRPTPRGDRHRRPGDGASTTIRWRRPPCSALAPPRLRRSAPRRRSRRPRWSPPRPPACRPARARTPPGPAGARMPKADDDIDNFLGGAFGTCSPTTIRR